MNESIFYIHLGALDVANFVSIAEESPKIIHVTNGKAVVNAKSLMGMMSLVQNNPDRLTVIFPNNDGKDDLNIVNQIKSKFEVSPNES